MSQISTKNEVLTLSNEIGIDLNIYLNNRPCNSCRIINLTNNVLKVKSYPIVDTYSFTSSCSTDNFCMINGSCDVTAWSDSVRIYVALGEDFWEKLRINSKGPWIIKKDSLIVIREKDLI